MNDILSSDGPRRLLTDLCQLINERAAVERKVHDGTAAANEAVENEFQKNQQAVTRQFQTAKAAAEQEYTSNRQDTLAKSEARRDALEKGYESRRSALLARFDADQKAAKQARANAHADAGEAFDVVRGGVNLPVDEVLAALDYRWQEMQQIHMQAVALLDKRGHWDQFPQTSPVTIRLEEHPGRRFSQALEQSKAELARLVKQRLPWFISGFRPFGPAFLVWIVATYVCLVYFGKQDFRWLVWSVGATAAVSIIGLVVAHTIATRNSINRYLALRQVLLEAGLGNPAVFEATKNDYRKFDAANRARRDAQYKTADEEYVTTLARIERRHQIELKQLDETHPKRIAELTEHCDRALKELDDAHQRRLQQLEEQYAADTAQLRERRHQGLRANMRRFDQEWNEMTEHWRTGMEQFTSSIDRIDRTCQELFPDWNTDDWNRWTMSKTIPPLIPFGRSQLKLAEIRDGMPSDEQLRPARTDFALPIVVPFPRRSLLLLKGEGADVGKAVNVMQSAMLRMLTAMPPSKVRFTIIDPVGLGNNFSAFMHLADFDEQLVANRIWTDANHIEQRLVDLTKHMETVIQVYLRKEFHNIEEYNEFAGEMAEPYRVLIVANFPANFSEAALQRLKSITSSGAQCGVFVLLSVDTRLPLPRNFRLSDLEADAMVMDCTEDTLTMEHPDFGPLPVAVEPPPPAERLKEILHTVGSRAKEDSRVEVPFSHIIPDPRDWWTGDSRTEIDVPLGRAGAMKLQSLALGRGTSQHVLVSGKTGSGKSTLLHVLVTNIAMRYSPDEIELYLVDFKKGVEFKAYARGGLPHARVIAIESEREFGLSVLQRLDAELRTRGDLFRKHGIQDVKGYRNAHPDTKLPRILLIFDEFQELFVEDDRIAQEASLLLDRLVRQGRAFGIHLFLGSQTLGGAYSLPRSTIGQMAVRIALQCSESDAHLILSEDNTAARLLTRPGEAIYNDANGLLEGNHPFQVVWLSDHERDSYLDRIQKFAEERHYVVTPAIVFEGNTFADPSENSYLNDLVAGTAEPKHTATVQAWLGSAVAIKEPAAAVFARQHASNLLVVGHREEAALGIFTSCFVSLAAWHLPDNGDEGVSDATFYILDGTRPETPEAGFWQQFTSIAPQSVKIADVRGASALIAEIAEEIAARQQEGRENAPPIYLFIHNLSRFRDLKKEDDYGFSADDGKTASPGKQFSTILREGPPLGVHTLVWGDSFSNVNRMLDRQSLREFESRVLFQMNASDSSSLMDTPEASRLGVHRAYLYDEGQGRVEKFRPYGLPPREWLARVQKQLHDRWAKISTAKK